MKREEGQGLRILLFFLLANALLRLGWSAVFARILDGEGATMALMAIEILHGRDFPLYMWQTSYASSFFSYILVPFFALFGVSGFVARSANLVLYSLFMVGVFGFVRRLSGRYAATLALAFFTLTPIAFNQRMWNLLGGYLDTYAVGAFTLWLCLWYTDRLEEENESKTITSRERLYFWGGVGFLWGFGSWLLLWMMPFIAGEGFWLLLKRERWPRGKETAAGAAGLLIGAAPLLYYNLWLNPGGTFLRLTGRALHVSRGTISAGGGSTVIENAGRSLTSYITHFLPDSFRMLGMTLGIVPYPSKEFLLNGMGGILLLVGWLGLLFVVSGAWRRNRRSLLPLTVLFLAVPFAAVAGMSSFSHIASFSYIFMLLVLLVAAGVGDLFKDQRYKKGRTALLLILLILSVYGLRTIVAIANADLEDRRSRFPQMAPALLERNLNYVYGDYNSAYLLTFESEGRITGSPTLGSLVVDRYPAYGERLAKAPLNEIAYLFYQNEDLKDRFEVLLNEEGISYQKFTADGLVAYHHLSRRVDPGRLEIRQKDYVTR